MQGHDADRTKYDDRDYSVTCVQCGTHFEARRSDASFCSARCRVAYSREPKKLEMLIVSIQAQTRQLWTIGIRHKKNQRVYEALVAMRDNLNKIIAQFESEV